jgi:hypothetical protein
MSTLSLPQLMTASDVADWLRQTSRRVERMARRKEIPCVQLPDGSLVFDQDDLAIWLETRKATAQEGR